VGPDFQPPAPPEVDRYTPGPLPSATALAAGQAQRFDPDLPVPSQWWRQFRCTALDALVRRSLLANPTIEAAAANLSASQNRLRAGYGVFFPQVNAGFDAQRLRSAPVQQGLAVPGSVYSLVTLSGTIGYALDVFGGARRMVEGLQAQVQVAQYAGSAAFLALTANVVNTAMARAAYAAQARTTEQLIELEEQQLRSTQVQVDAGTASDAAVLALRTQLAANRALLAPLRQRIDQADHLLATLAGVAPAQLDGSAIELAAMALPADLPLSLPSELVRRRPDILTAEAQLHIASAQIGVATAALLPAISLNAEYGSAGSGVGNLLGAGARFWSIGPSVSVPLFRGGSLWYGRQAALDEYRAAQAGYREAVLTAFGQVADVLTALDHDAAALQAQDEAQRSAGQALQLLQAGYGAGMVAYLDVLSADVQYHQASLGYLQALAQRLQDTVALYVALGGGWDESHRPLADGAAQ
jgi:NodT family efflux transporter outer membrane factor (OMF) lipoprotein